MAGWLIRAATAQSVRKFTVLASALLRPTTNRFIRDRDRLSSRLPSEKI